MSEYQYVAFEAVDRPLTERELAFANKQSSRAEITEWLFESEYNFADFRGDRNGLLRHGYDVHLHYANFGIRTIAMRLPAGLPFPKPVWSRYIGVRGLELGWKKDSKGNGGILSLSPCREQRAQIGSPGEYLDDVIEIRERLIAGDARALYALWLCAALDDQVDSTAIIEPPVPGGLAECSESCCDLLEFFGLDPLILVAASEGAPMIGPQQEDSHGFEAWVDALGVLESKSLLRKLLFEDASDVKAETLAAIRELTPRAVWPTAALRRTLEALLNRTEVLRAEYDAKEEKKRQAAARREAAKKERERQNRLAEMVKAPQKWLHEAEQLADARGTKNYNAAAEILADLREAVGGDEGAQITRNHAAHLTKKHPTLKRLKSSFRKHGLLEK